jgi:hypothetical protein
VFPGSMPSSLWTLDQGLSLLRLDPRESRRGPLRVDSHLTLGAWKAGWNSQGPALRGHDSMPSWGGVGLWVHAHAGSPRHLCFPSKGTACDVNFRNPHSRLLTAHARIFPAFGAE